MRCSMSNVCRPGSAPLTRALGLCAQARVQHSAGMSRYAVSSALILCLILLSPAALQAEVEPLHTDGRLLRDARGGNVLLRGLNVSGDAKVPPFRGIDDMQQLDVLPELGVNVVRLLFTWEAFEPMRGAYDESYLAYYTNLVDALGARGMHVIVDIHQDAFSRHATQGCGDGFPAWAISDEAERREPDNGRRCVTWGIQMVLDPQTQQLWKDFYSNRNGLRESYLAMLERIAQQLANKPAVLGYDMMNEPGGDEVREIAPLYEDAARRLRAHDADAVLFVSPGSLTSAGARTELPRPTFDNFVYAPHYYDAAVSQLHRWLGTSLADPVRQMDEQAAAFNAPLFVGEFGAPADGQRSSAYIDEFYTQFDARLISAAQWNFTPHWTQDKKDGWNLEDFSIVDDTGKLRATYRVRPFPARVAGEATAFIAAADRVELEWRHAPEAGETRLFAPAAALFGGQVSIQSSGELQCEYEESQRYLRCSASGAGIKRVRLVPCGDAAPCVGALSR